MDLYSILGVQNGVDSHGLKRAYKRLILKEHPDKGGTRERFQQINDAYTILSNPDFKDIYLKRGVTDLTRIQSIVKAKNEPRKITKEEALRVIPTKPPPLRYNLYLDVKDIYLGKSLKLNIRCDRFCEGCTRGGNFGCKICNGKHVITENKTYDVRILPGLKHGDILCIEGGNGNKMGFIEKSDLHLIIHVRKDGNFKRIKNDIWMKCKLSLKEALCGFTKEFVHLSGHKITLTSNKVIQQGQQQRIKGFGFPYIEEKAEGTEEQKTGDLIIEYDIQIPKQISEEFKRLCEIHLD
jgi:DnaJ-class molecular chaperone